MTEAMQPVRLAGAVLSRSCHVCAFFHSKEEEYEVLMPFIKEGFEKGDRAFHVVDPKHRQDHLRRLEFEESTSRRPRAEVSSKSAAGRMPTSRTTTSISTA